MNRTRILGLLSILALIFGPVLSRAAAVKDVTDASGATRGICVVLGQPECGLALDLVKQTEFLVYTLALHKMDGSDVGWDLIEDL